jgi:hypothetical protein
MTLSTILQCLSQEHPTYDTPNREKMEQSTVSASSTTTIEQVPPKILVRKDPQYWIAYANEFLRSHEALTNSDLAGHDAPLKLPNAMANEADVVSIANQQILDPVLTALIAKYPHLELMRSAESAIDQLRVDVLSRARRLGKMASVLSFYWSTRTAGISDIKSLTKPL